MNTTNGKIAEQSKRKFVQALLVVMEQYDFKEITITQIAQEAKLSRKTFYRLFPDKEAVLKLFFHELFTDCITQLKTHNIHRYWDLVQLYFDFWESRKEVLTLLKKNNILSLLFEYSYQHSIEIFISVRSEETAEHFSHQMPYLLAYSVGGMHTMLFKWIEKDMEILSSELIEKLKIGFMSDEI